MSETFRSQQTIIRAELRQVFGDRPRLIKAFENLLFDVSVTIPEALAGNSIDADDAANAQALAIRADSTAQQALASAAAANDGPPVVMLSQLPSTDDQPPQIVLAPSSDSSDDWLAVVYQLVARVARLEVDLANLKDGPTP